jgi:hypothetical protein
MIDEEDDYAEHFAKQEAAIGAAEKQFGAAVRAFLWELVRIHKVPEWEYDPALALLAVARVTLTVIGLPFYPARDQNADEALICITHELAKEFRDLGLAPGYDD